MDSTKSQPYVGNQLYEFKKTTTPPKPMGFDETQKQLVCILIKNCELFKVMDCIMDIGNVLRTIEKWKVERLLYCL